ncbi:MAG: alpha/beta hydrolase [Alphaproteobacteria bacterium]|nr:alpha/beta hydrolase [Alphaproteobacteria bacterium]MCZ6741209.1 alpha/beta hydrolase [Alphaproteobacteria bacterium]MCZ6848119.1 alpha/beta hydrolase [Alphaproteobacteria bacterium]
MPKQRIGTGIELYYETHGQGEPIVLIPSTAYGANVWNSCQVPALSKDLQVITFDPRGCGRTSAPDGVYTMEQLACDVAALLDHLGVRSAHVLGHSMGGRVALALALAYPGRVRSLILAASGSGPAIRSGEECVPGLPFRLVDELVALGFEEFIRHEICETATFFTDEYRKTDAEAVRAFYHMAWQQHARWPAYLRLIMARHTWEGTHRLGDISMPTLIMIGGADDIGSNHTAQSQALLDRIPGAKKVVLKGQTHGFFWQAPDETNALILDWVKRHAGGVVAAA